jgi:peptidoglycan hydrolase-like protein with peptidoglycan-binding domain
MSQSRNTSQRSQLRNEDVRQAQTALQDLGLYNGAIDGLYGPKTINAVSQFQAQRQIPQTGALDQKTMRELQSAAANGGGSQGATQQGANQQSSGQPDGNQMGSGQGSQGMDQQAEQPTGSRQSGNPPQPGSPQR